MQSRPFGQSGVSLDALCLGAMRFTPARLPPPDALRYLEESWELGARTWHTSSEYDTHAHFCASLAAFRRARPSARVTHVSKIAAPHFEDARFDRALLRSRVESQLRDLGADRLDVVQWLARSKPVSDELRLPALAAMRDELRAEVESLRREGKVGAWAAFPYSTAWAAAFAGHEVCDGLVTYLNLAELEYAGELDAMAARGDGFVAIRPFGGGMLVGASGDDTQRARGVRVEQGLASMGVPRSELPRFAMRFPLLHPNVASVMLSASTVGHLREAVEATRDVTPDPALFARVAAAVST